MAPPKVQTNTIPAMTIDLTKNLLCDLFGFVDSTHAATVDNQQSTQFLPQLTAGGYLQDRNVIVDGEKVGTADEATVALLMAYAGLGLELCGAGLWPGFAVRLALAAWCVTCLRARRADD